jgi:DNA-binding GntR family transcriptional regulator
MSHRNSESMDWSVAPQRSLPEAVAERVTEAIRIGALKPGQRIIESTLAQQLGVSRGPLREALKSLEANHLVETRRGRGAYIAQPSSAQLLEMVAVRAILEGLAARLVAANATPETILQLKRQHAAIRKEATAGRTERWRDLDWQFHETICKLSGNEFLLKAWQHHSNLIRLFLHSHYAFDHDVESVLHNHELFLAALSSRNPDEAETVFRGIILKSGYNAMNADVPGALLGIVTAGSREKGSHPGERKTARRSSLAE